MMIKDDATRYGLVSRVLHWAMAALFLWQFAGMILKSVIGKGPLMAFWVGSHASVGVTLLALMMLRALWALAQRAHRPPYHQGVIGTLGRLGHGGLYALMFVVPALALLRLLGSGKPVQLFGLPIRPETGERVLWMMQPANLLHGYLAWLLLIVIAGHVAMVFVHRFLWKDDILPRML
ncbi:MAG: cytochrome b [Sphingobium sp.]